MSQTSITHQDLLKKENERLQKELKYWKDFKKNLNVFEYPNYNPDTHNGCDGIDNKCPNGFVIPREYKDHEPLFHVNDERHYGWFCVDCARKLDKKYPGMVWGGMNEWNEWVWAGINLGDKKI
jgi:hypothetical protein